MPPAAAALFVRFAAIACLLVGGPGRVLAQAELYEVAERVPSRHLVDSSSLLTRIALSLAEGEPRAIRDLATLLGRSDSKTEASTRLLLTEHTYFGEAIDLSTCSRQQLLDFYYSNYDSLRYSELLDGYLVRPLERQPVAYRLVPLDEHQRSDRSMHLRKYITYVDQAVANRSVADLRDLAEKIADLQLLEGQAYLLTWLAGPAGNVISSDLDAFLHYLDQLLQRPSVEVAEALFESERRGYLRSGSLAYYLSRLCNVPFSANWDAATHRRHYGDLLDSLGSLSRVREFGYLSSVGFSQNHFREPVDYYGRVLSRVATPTYVQHNALIDLVATQHPRSLFYISTQLLAARQGRPTAYPTVYYLYLLRKLTNLGVSIPDADDHFVFELEVEGGRSAWVNFVRYWATHYEDYDFDEHRASFVNRHDHSLTTENLERQFRLLNSEREEVALGAYERLTRADAIEVGQLVVKYKDLLRSTHPNVPALKDGHLEHTAQLTAYCVRNRINFDAEPSLRATLDSLLLPLVPRSRVKLENRLVAQLTLADLTAVEYWASIHQYDLDAGYSIGRILDYSYTRHWSELLASDAQLRLFLKKAVLFARMEGIGISDSYIRKFQGLDAASRARIEALILSESDKHIARTLRRLLSSSVARDALALRDVDEFLEAPEPYSREEIAELPVPTLEQLSELMWRSSDASSAKARHLYRVYLEGKLSLDLVPDLMSLLIRNDNPETVSGLLADIYHYRWPGSNTSQAEAWLNRWRLRSKDYRSWGDDFYAEHIATLQNASTVTGPELNAVLSSPNYKNTDRALVLTSLAKLGSARHLFMLRFDPALDWSERGALDALPLSYKELQDLDKLFRNAKPADLVDYIMTRASTLSAEDSGRLLNALLRKPWTEDLLDDPAFARASSFASTLRTYLEESDNLSEFEEQNTTLNLARLDFIGKTPLERLRASIDLRFEDVAKLRIQENILARLSYADLPEALRLYPRLSAPEGRHPYNFLNQDFGLPIFDLVSTTQVDTFAARHARLKPRDLYLSYLREFGLNLVTASGELNYDGIYEILNYDIVLPFIGGGGNRRDLYTYGVIRLLELDEKELLGFHPKLNENQLFYSYTASKRASAWAKYLLEKGLVRRALEASQPSFNVGTGD